MIGYKRISLLVEKALKLSANTGDKVLNYGEGNLYPQNIAELIMFTPICTQKFWEFISVSANT